MKIPPRKNPVAFNLCCWKKKRNVLSSPMTKAKPEMKRICKKIKEFNSTNIDNHCAFCLSQSKAIPSILLISFGWKDWVVICNNQKSSVTQLTNKPPYQKLVTSYCITHLQTHGHDLSLKSCKYYTHLSLLNDWTVYQLKSSLIFKIIATWKDEDTSSFIQS